MLSVWVQDYDLKMQCKQDERKKDEKTNGKLYS